MTAWKGLRVSRGKRLTEFENFLPGSPGWVRVRAFALLPAERQQQLWRALAERIQHERAAELRSL